MCQRFTDQCRGLCAFLATLYLLMCAVSRLQWAATFCPKSEIHFRLQPAQYLSPRSSDGEVAVLVWAAETPLSLYPPKHRPPATAEPKLIWISKQIRFPICIWMRAWSADIHYRGWLCGRGHKSGSQRCHRDESYFVLTDFFPVSICPHICNCNRPPQETSKLEGRGSNMKKYWDIGDQNDREQTKHCIRKVEEILFERDAGIWNLQTPLQETKPS